MSRVEKPPTTITSVEEREIRVGLDPKEREPIMKELLTKLDELDSVRIEAKDTAGHYRKKIKTIDKDAGSLRITLEQGRPEMHEVKITKNFKKQKVYVHRVDNGFLVEERDMVEQDHQLDLGGAVDPDEGNDMAPDEA